MLRDECVSRALNRVKQTSPVCDLCTGALAARLVCHTGLRAALLFTSAPRLLLDEGGRQPSVDELWSSLHWHARAAFIIVNGLEATFRDFPIIGTVNTFPERNGKKAVVSNLIGAAVSAPAARLEERDLRARPCTPYRQSCRALAPRSAYSRTGRSSGHRQRVAGVAPMPRTGRGVWLAA
jgi:hypothetical protein